MSNKNNDSLSPDEIAVKLLKDLSNYFYASPEDMQKDALLTGLAYRDAEISAMKIISNEWEMYFNKSDEQNKKLQARCEIYEKALEFYADDTDKYDAWMEDSSTGDEIIVCPIRHDSGAVARKALASKGTTNG